LAVVSVVTLGDIARLCGGRIRGDADRPWEPGAVSIDTREIKPGDLFVALRAERDGHDFVAQAAERGAGGAIVEEERPLAPLPSGFPLIEVEETLSALQRWAGAHRAGQKATVIAVTGSSGKTTAKDRLAGILAEDGPTRSTRANLNNHIGVPLTLLSLRPEDRWAVIETAMNHPGEIAPLARIAKPDHAVITTIGWAHIGPFGTREAILEEKLDLVRALPPGGTFFHEEDPWLAERLPEEIRRMDRKTFGLHPGADLHPDWIDWDLTETRFETAYTGPVRYPCPGRGTLLGALAACLVARTLGVPGGLARRALEAASPRPLRMEPRPLAGATAMLDCYNASPESSHAAVAFLLDLPRTGRRWLAFGEMRELGARSEEAHRLLGERAADLDGVFFLGEGCRPALDGFRGRAAEGRFAELYEDVDEMALEISRLLQPGDVVLFKGSRAMAMERVFEACTKHLNGEA
jgi:UDP-N-acetylmuramoyl-tripeptide--D-alanyl-D-alanine ligase